MNILNLFKVSFKAVANNKMRSFLSMLGIIIGVAAVIIMMAIGQGSKESIRAELSTMGTNLLTIRPGADMRGGVRQDPSAMQTLKMADYERILLLATALKLTLNRFSMFIIRYSVIPIYRYSDIMRYQSSCGLGRAARASAADLMLVLTVSSRILPSRRLMLRDEYSAISGLCVTKMMVWPWW